MVNTSELQELVKKLIDKRALVGAVENSLFNASQWLVGESIKPNNHRYVKRTGALGSAVTAEVNGLSSEVFIDLVEAPHGKFVYDGTKDRKDRKIVPKNKKALSWTQGGQRFFSKGHKVKGWKADPFILNTFNRKRSIFTKMMQKDLTEEIQEIIE